MKHILFMLVFAVVVVSTAAAGVNARAETLSFTGAVVIPAGGMHPSRPIVNRQVVEQTIHETDFRVLVIVYR